MSPPPPPGSDGRSWRTPLATSLVRQTASLSRHLHLGSGSTVGGRVGQMVDPQLLAHLTAGKRTLLVSGTNGKTTTTRLVAEAASRLGSVATSGAGANMDAGMISALASTPSARIAVLEVDEAHLPGALRATSADVVILLNLSRDQLDRTSEVRMLAERWRDVASQHQRPHHRQLRRSARHLGGRGGSRRHVGGGGRKLARGRLSLPGV